MAQDPLIEWEREFRHDAWVDRYALARQHLRRLGLPERPRRFVTGTVMVVQSCAVYANMDGLPVADFLAMQKYDPAAVPEATYAFTFDLFSHAYGRVLAPAKIPTMDLADLEGAPWWEYEVCGYRGFWVERTDGRAISAEEEARLEADITKDLRFDYTEEELDVWFDGCSLDGSLYVGVQQLR